VPIVRLLHESGFDAEQTERLGAAFDVAWQVLKTRKPELARGPQTAAAREQLAKFVIDEGRKGKIKDERLLAEQALRHFEASASTRRTP
jgi:hypothetical protein